jgi:pyridoxal phosphate enzyme (YggS family)
MVAKNLRDIVERMAAAAVRAGRDPADVELVAVSKNQPPARILEATHAGLRVFGENRAQELRQKSDALTGVEWDFIGHLQTNKVSEVVGRVRLIHSVDSERLAGLVAKKAVTLGIMQDILIQVNVSGEESKSGADLVEVQELVEAALAMPGVRVRGLMTMAPWDAEPEGARPVFRRLKRLGEELREELPQADLTVLSMGMTGDYEVAIEEGSTLVRIGTGIFGSRADSP